MIASFHVSYPSQISNPPPNQAQRGKRSHQLSVSPPLLHKKPETSRQLSAYLLNPLLPDPPWAGRNTSRWSLGQQLTAPFKGSVLTARLTELRVVLLTKEWCSDNTLGLSVMFFCSYLHLMF